MIKGQNVKAPLGYFISNQHTNKELDPNFHVIDGIYNIKGRLTLQIFVANYINFANICSKLYKQTCHIQQKTVQRSFRTIN